ncbi:PX-domain-containing protein [Backusella circina FSU 941]|nr:PX-domain-containing protein [Backusella circina FSU 941]
MNDFIGSSFQTPANNNYFLPSESFNDPWNASDFVPKTTPHAITSSTSLIDDELVANGLTAANVLMGVDLPEIFDTAYIRAGPVGDRISMEALEQVVALAGMGHRLYDQISVLIVPPGALYLTRNEFYTAMALVGCAQKNMDLPIPSLPNLNQLQIKRVNPIMTSSKQNSTNTQYVDDPWRLSSTPPSASTIQNTTSDLFPVYPQRSNTIKQPAHRQPSLPESPNESFSNIDQITISVSERTGFLMFGHVNYLVSSSKQQTSVLRRYNDFFHFYEYLIKKYPFRMIPSLPPKKMTGKDEAFLESRCQHLDRFLNCVARHPVLRNDEFLKVFLTEQQELSSWKKTHPLLDQEEFDTMESSIDELESSIPSNLDAIVTVIKERLPITIQKYTQLIQSMRRSFALQLARAQEYKHYNETLRELGEMEQHCYMKDCHACGHGVRGYITVGQSLEHASTLMEAQVNGTSVLNNLERHKDICISFLNLLDRRTKLGVPLVDALVKKVADNKLKRGHDGGSGEENDDALAKPASCFRLKHKRNCYLLYCLASELSYLHKQHTFVTRLYQTYVHEELHYARQAVDNWRNVEIQFGNILLSDTAPP